MGGVSQGTRWEGEEGELERGEEIHHFYKTIPRHLWLCAKLNYWLEKRTQTFPSVPGSGESVTNIPLDVLVVLHTEKNRDIERVC